MEVTHILLFERQVTYDNVTNKFSFEHKDKKVTFKPLSSCEVLKGQIKMEKNKRYDEIFFEN
ncbi:hypothetical protein CR513_59306, partial [Mucuna pruriens]